jgi:hypothetical protein
LILIRGGEVDHPKMGEEGTMPVGMESPDRLVRTTDNFVIDNGV